MKAAWFETVAEAQRRARKRLPSSVYGALLAGTEKGLTVSDNVAAFDEIGFAPHVAGGSAQRELATTVLGQQISLPVMPAWSNIHMLEPAQLPSTEMAAAVAPTPSLGDAVRLATAARRAATSRRCCSAVMLSLLTVWVPSAPSRTTVRWKTAWALPSSPAAACVPPHPAIAPAAQVANIHIALLVVIVVLLCFGFATLTVGPHPHLAVANSRRCATP